MHSIIPQLKARDWRFLRKIGQHCSAIGGKAFMVGGCVRSALLGEAVYDYDLEIFGLEPEQAETFLRQLAPVTQVGKAFGIYKLKGWPIDVGLPRRERKSGLGHRGFEVSIDPHMSLQDAAMRRDFTVNAIYFDIEQEEIADPLGGVADLQKGILRHCSPRFAEDSLRVLRAMQLAARIPASVAEETIALCRGLNPEGLSPERFLMEWEKLLLMGKQPSKGLQFLREAEWIQFFPELEALINCPQDERWHPEGDVWTHTLHCMDAFVGLRSGEREEDLVVGLAVLCHDFGKPQTTIREEISIRSPGHESAGLEPARRFMSRLRVPNRMVEQVLPLIKCHMRPLFLYKDQSSPAAVRRLARDCGRLDRLLKVVQADAAGRPPLPGDVIEAIDWIRVEAERQNIERTSPDPLIKGRDLLQRGWQSGPAMGRFLKKAYEQQLEGTFSNREEAMDWLDRQKLGNPEFPDTH